MEHNKDTMENKDKKERTAMERKDTDHKDVEQRDTDHKDVEYTVRIQRIVFSISYSK